MGSLSSPDRKVAAMSKSENRGIMNFRTVTGLLLALCCVQQVSAQSFNYWIDPSGGLWNDPSNWSDGFVPGPTDAGYLILDADYTILSQETTARDLYVDAGRIDFRTTASATLSVSGLCEITGNLNSGNPASLRLFGPGTAAIGELQLGLANIGSELSIAAARTVVVDTAVSTSFSTLRFELDSHSAAAGAALDVRDRAFLPGTLVLSGSVGDFPEAGDVVLLADGRQAATGIQALPRFGLIEPPSGLDVLLDFNVNQSTGLFRLLTGKVVEAEAAASVILEQDLVVNENPIDLLVVDLDGDGDDDLVLIRANGKHPVLLRSASGSFVPSTELSSNPGVVGGAAGDFDQDGFIDLAIISSTVALGRQVELFLNLNGDAIFSPGPFTSLDEEPVSITAIRIPDAFSFTDSTGVGITTASNSRGKTSAYKTTANDLTKAGEVEVGDEPGPSDPIDDENKKDPGSVIGVAAESDALVPQPVLQIIRTISPTSGGLEIVETVVLSGTAIDFVSGDLDEDGIPETLVITDAGRLDLIDYGTQTEVFSVPIAPNARAIALGDLDSEGGRDVVIAFEDGANQGRLCIYEAMIWPSTGAPDVNLRFTLNLRSEVPIPGIEPGTLGAVSGSESRIVLAGEQTNGVSRFESRRYEEVPIGGCVSADFNADGRVDSDDLGILIGFWGVCKGGCPADFNDDGMVGPADLGVLFSEWGPC